MRARTALRAGALALVIATTASIPATADTSGTVTTAGHGRYTASITRGEYGIPHIKAKDLPSAGFGYGYAFAQDNMCTLADLALTMRGERSRYLGPDGVADSGLGVTSNLNSDVYYRSVVASGRIPAILADRGRLAPSREARSLVAGYVAGVNRYLEKTGVHRLPDPTCRGAKWVRPLTELDVWSVVHDVNQLGGTLSLLPQIVTATPPTAPGGDTSAPRVAQSDYGSNGWALGSEATRGGRGMLLANPHFPWRGGKRFYQLRVSAPGLDVSGAGLYGTPFVAIGHNRSLAWTHTVSTAQRFTLFQLQLVPGDPTSYVVDGKAEKMTAVDVPVETLGEDGRLSTVHRTLYTSRYGPLVSTGWTTASAFAVRGANANNLRDADEWLGYSRAGDVRELERVQRRYQSLPFVNTIAADRNGAAYYADASVVPHVTDEHAKRCVDTPEGLALYPDQTVLNGARSECGWGRDRDAVEPGIFGPDRMPRQTRRDYVGNSNESPWLTNAHAPLTGYPRMFGDIAGERSLRDRSSHTLVADRLAGTDGLGRPGFDLATLRTVAFGNRVHSGELMRDGVVELCRANPTMTASTGATVDVTAACDVLAGWDLRGDLDSRGTALWHEFYAGAERVRDRFTVPFDPADPVHTPNTVNQGSAGLQTALADAVLRFQAVGTPLDVRYGDVQRYRPATGPIPVHGCPGQDGCFNVITPTRQHLDATGYGDVRHGSSFVMAVEFTRSGPRVSTILTYSQSANPASRHHTDQTELYSRKQWVSER
jgi:acyl-homoserine-lactone acylase